MSSPPESRAACDLHLTLPSSLCCSFSNANLCAGLPGCLAQCEPCVRSSRVLLQQIPQGLNRPCYLLSPFFCVPCVHKFPWKQGNSEQRPLRNVDAFFLKQIYSSLFLLCCGVSFACATVCSAASIRKRDKAFLWECEAQPPT